MDRKAPISEFIDDRIERRCKNHQRVGSADGGHRPRDPPIPFALGTSFAGRVEARQDTLAVMHWADQAT
jgi:hypothetical protein